MVLGYPDPNLLEANTVLRARLTRLLLLNMSAVKKWGIVCKDVESAFLHGRVRLKLIDAFLRLQFGNLARPYRVLGLKDGQPVQLFKSVCVLASAPREWYEDVQRALVS